MTSAPEITVGRILEILDLKQTAEDTFAGMSLPMGLPQVFGGQLIAQSLLAAARTVPAGTIAHSLHLYFLRPGENDGPIEFRVERIRDGRRMAVRTVRALQGGRVLTTMTLSFLAGVEIDDAAPEHQAPMPSASPPEELLPLQEFAQPWGGLTEMWACLSAMDCRVDSELPGLAWIRLNERVGDDPVLHQALLAYLTDITLMSSVMEPHGLPIGIERRDGKMWEGLSLDHAIWLYRPARADNWLLFAQESPSSVRGRGFARAEIFAPDGTLAASCAQEGIFYVHDQPVG